jgi:hypothetical protein
MLNSCIRVCLKNVIQYAEFLKRKYFLKPSPFDFCTGNV